MQSLSWYLYRLRCMSLAEVHHRGRTQLRALRESWISPRDLPHRCGDPSEGSSDTNNVRFFFEGRDLKAIQPVLETVLPKTLSFADALCEHRFTFFGLNNTFWGKLINWHYDPTQQIIAPRKPSYRLDYRDVRVVGEVKYIWELNRHQHLPPLALACLLSGKKQYMDEITKQIRDWTDQNPYGIGINWTSALEAALRLISWSWTYFLLKAAGQRLPRSFFQSLGEHCGFIHNNFSLHSSRGNHLVGEAAGLFIAAMLFGREPHRTRWISDAYRTLTTQVQELVHPDGAYAELSTGYHRFVTELFLLPALLGQANGIQFPPYYWNRLDKMILYLHEIQDCAGWQPDLGDNDSARCLALGNPLSDEGRFLLTTGAILFEKPHYLENVERLDGKTLLLLGKTAQERFSLLKKKTEPRKSPSSRAFPDAGTYILRSRKEDPEAIFLLFDAGPMGMEPMAGHGHADTLSFVLSVDGQPFFIDPGTYTYRTGDPWRDYFRGTSAHNTLRIDQEDLSVPGGGFLWIRKARCRVIEWNGNSENPSIKAAHDGYKRLADPVLHTREIRLDRKRLQILITDEIHAEKRHTVEIFFHIDPSCDVQWENGVYWILGGNKRIGLVLDSRFENSCVKGQTDPILGWCSQHYGHKEPTNTITGSDSPFGRTTYETRILFEG